jgi:hypothetical protein
VEEDSSWEALESRPEHSVNPNAIGDSNFITLPITAAFAEADGHGSVYVSRGVYCNAAVARPDHLPSPPRLIVVLRALRSNSCHLAPAKARAPSSKHASPKPTRDHPCCRRSSKVDISESEIAKILTPHLMFMRCPFHFKLWPVSLPFFKDTSIRDMKSKPSTPRAPVPGISPSCSGTQSPRHPHLAASCIGQRCRRANYRASAYLP